MSETICPIDEEVLHQLRSSFLPSSHSHSISLGDAVCVCGMNPPGWKGEHLKECPDYAPQWARDLQDTVARIEARVERLEKEKAEQFPLTGPNGEEMFVSGTGIAAISYYIPNQKTLAENEKK